MAVEYHGTKEGAWQAAGKFCAQPDKNLPVQHGCKEIEVSNGVMDFRMDIKAPARDMSISQVNGPMAQHLGAGDRTWIKQRIEAIWKETDPELTEEMNTIAQNQGFEQCETIIWLILVLISGCVCLLCCICRYSQVNNGKSRDYGNKCVEWDGKFIEKLKTFIHDELKSKYRNLEFSIIYPVNVYQNVVYITTKDGRQVGNQRQVDIIQHIFLYLRVSKGAIPPGDDYEPMIDSTAGGQSVTLSVRG